MKTKVKWMRRMKWPPEVAKQIEQLIFLPQIVFWILMLWIVEGSCMNSSDIWKRHGASSMLGLILKSMAVSKLRTIAKTIWKRKKVFNKDMSKTSIGTYLEICTSAIHTLCIFELLEFISHIIFLSILQMAFHFWLF